MAHALALVPTVGTSGLISSQAVAGPDPDRIHVHVLAQSRSTGTAQASGPPAARHAALSGAPLHVLAQSRSTGTAQASGPPAARHAALSGAPPASALAALDGIIHTASELHTQLGATGQSRAAHDNTLINTQSPDDLCDSEISSEGGDEPFHLADGDSAQVITARTAAMRLRAGERQAQQRAEFDGKALQRAEDDARAAGYWRRGGSPWRDLELTLSRLDVGLSRLNVSPRAEAPTALLEA